MKNEQLMAGIICQTLLFSIAEDFKFGNKPRTKLANAFRKQFFKVRSKDKTM